MHHYSDEKKMNIRSVHHYTNDRMLITMNKLASASLAAMIALGTLGVGVSVPANAAPVGHQDETPVAVQENPNGPLPCDVNYYKKFREGTVYNGYKAFPCSLNTIINYVKDQKK